LDICVNNLEDKMKKAKLIVSCLVLGMVALFYVVSYAQTTTISSDNKESCCASCPCCSDGKCADGACKMKDKHASHAEHSDMKDGDCCKMKGEKAGNTQSGDKKSEGCCADGVCKMKDKKDAAGASQASGDKESCCSGGSCGCCQKKAS
jgi:hypothetical protein